MKKRLQSIELFVPVQISWIDSYSSADGWVDIDDFDFEEHTKTTKQFLSTGYVVHIDDYNLFISVSISPEENAMYGCFSIPIASIFDVTVLKGVKIPDKKAKK